MQAASIVRNVSVDALNCQLSITNRPNQINRRFHPHAITYIPTEMHLSVFMSFPEYK